MGTRSRVLAALLLFGVGALVLPSTGLAGSDEQIDWNAVKATAPEDWSEELQAQLVAAGHDLEVLAGRVRLIQRSQREEATARDGARLHALRPRIAAAAMATAPEDWSEELKAAVVRAGWDLDEFMEGIRQRQEMAASERSAEPQRDDGVDWEAVKTTSPEDWSDELKAQIVAAGYDVGAIAERVRLGQQKRDEDPDRGVAAELDAIGRRIRMAVANGDMTAEEGRKKWQAARERLAAGDADDDDRLREFQRGVAARAMAAPPEEWTDELKAAILRARWDLDDFTEGIRQRQAAARESGDASRSLTGPQAGTDTAVQERTWGQVKAEVANPE